MTTSCRLTRPALVPSATLHAERWWRRVKADPWVWLTECVWTLDQTDLTEPIKQYPVWACLACQRPHGGPAPTCPRCGGATVEIPYVRTVVEAWQRERILFVPKARRMRLTWLLCALETWLAVVHPGAEVYLVSSKEDKSRELIDRCQFILDHVPAPLGARVPQPERTQSPPRLKFPASQLVGVGEGPDQLRQYGATAILFDEWATWKWPRASLAAAKPCLEGGGRLTIVSSAYPGVWRSACEGELFV